MERVPKARAQNREKPPADAESEIGTPHTKAWAAVVPAEGRARWPVNRPAVVRAEVKGAVGSLDQFIGRILN